MLVLCYGITKSGSTLAFELVKGALETAGYSQPRLSDGVSEPGHHINFVAGTVARKRILKLLAEIGPHRRIAVKTHGGFPSTLFPWLEELQANRQLQVIASFRDPRDICLSLIDAGAQARARGRKAFSEIVDLSTAVRTLKRQLVRFQAWAALRGTLRLDFETVAFDTDVALDKIENVLELVCDKEVTKEYAFEKAFTQRNKGEKHRFRRELTLEDQQRLTSAFDTFIQQVCEQHNDSWFEEARTHLLGQSRKVQAPKRSHKPRAERRGGRRRGRQRVIA